MGGRLSESGCPISQWVSFCMGGFWTWKNPENAWLVLRGVAPGLHRNFRAHTVHTATPETVVGSMFQYALGEGAGIRLGGGCFQEPLLQEPSSGRVFRSASDRAARGKADGAAIRVAGCSTPPSARGSATPSDLHPPSPHVAATPQRAPHTPPWPSPNCPQTPGDPSPSAACAYGPSSAIVPALEWGPIETQLGNPSLPARRSAPKKKQSIQPLPPRPHLSPHKIRLHPMMGDFMGGHGHFSGGHFPTLSYPGG
jgi:hypothetical protein